MQVAIGSSRTTSSTRWSTSSRSRPTRRSIRQSLTNANNLLDYNYAQFGVDYSVDVSQPVGSRIVGLSYQGVPVAAGQQFLVAVNNYRQSGGGGFPHIATAPVVYNAQVAIREAIVCTPLSAGTIDPATFHVENWRLVRNGTPVF